MGIVNLYLSLVYVSLLEPNINRKLLERTAATNKETLGKGQNLEDEVGCSQPGLGKHTRAERARSGPRSWQYFLEEVLQAVFIKAFSIGAGIRSKCRLKKRARQRGFTVMNGCEGSENIGWGLRIGEAQRVSRAHHCLLLYLCPPSAPTQALFCKAGMPVVISNRMKLRPREIRRLM